MAKFGAILAQGIIDAGERERILFGLQILWNQGKHKFKFPLVGCFNEFISSWMAYVIEYIIKDTNKNSFIAV